jgi:hypothetical protein
LPAAVVDGSGAPVGHVANLELDVISGPAVAGQLAKVARFFSGFLPDVLARSPLLIKREIVESSRGRPLTSFHTIGRMSDEQGDVGRARRRGCFRGPVGASMEGVL